MNSFFSFIFFKKNLILNFDTIKPQGSKKFMRFIFLLLLLIILNSCNLENGVNKNYIISQMKEKEDVDQNAK